jgi:hypothetical protein
MRSEMIFRAQEKVANRYRLCHAASKVSRCLHHFSSNTRDAITDAFVRIADVPCLAEAKESVPYVMPIRPASVEEPMAEFLRAS